MSGSRTAKARAQAIDTFTRRLVALREEAGTPSFREMAARSGIISHTTLHEAYKGHRLPSWDTTVEFVKACGAEPSNYRSTWEEAELALAMASSSERPRRRSTPTRAGPAPLLPSDDTTVSAEVGADVSEETPGEDGRGRPRWIALASATAVAAAAIALWAWHPWASEGPAVDTAMNAEELPATACPVHQTNPPPADPAYEGDDIDFVADVTLQDCTVVEPDETVVKTWRFENSGTVPWERYSLRRIDAQDRHRCQTVPEIPVPATAPGETVDVSTYVRIPLATGFCFVRFKMYTDKDVEAFPAGRPVNFQVIVDDIDETP